MAIAPRVWLAPVALKCDDATMVIVEAEQFEQLGGWVVDGQHLDQMGSAYLLAHGLGVPVADAVKTVLLPGAGAYRLWVRTRDWFSPGSPGRFEVLIDGKVAGEFGKSGPDWHWADGGMVRCPRQVEVRLHDLTGFDGRVDAICLSEDASWAPPDTRAELDALRHRSEPHEVGVFDLVVCGGGLAGLCSALTAARLGLKVALIHNRPVVGGNNSSEIRVHLSSKRNLHPWPTLGNMVAEMETAAEPADPERRDRFASGDEQKLALIHAEPRITLFAHAHLIAAQCSGGRIISVVVQEVVTGRRFRLKGTLFVDATGDGNLAAAAGAPYRVGREARHEFGEPDAPDTADRQVLGSTIHWYARAAKEAKRFPQIQWGPTFDAAREQNAYRSAWNWETGFDRDQVADAEWVRDNMLAMIYANWSYQVNQSTQRHKYAGFELAWVGYVLGKRESRRVRGDLVYSQADLLAAPGRYDDEFIACDWGVDIHVADPSNEALFGARAFRSKSLHHDRAKAAVRVLPYRCLYAGSLDNLFLAGRCASMSHLAHAWFRCQRTTGMMGELVGRAAAICAEHACTPRDVYHHHLAQLKRLAGMPAR